MGTHPSLPQSALQMGLTTDPWDPCLSIPLSPVQSKHFSISEVDIILLLMLQLADGDCGEGRKLFPKDHLKPKGKGTGERGHGHPLENTVRLRREGGPRQALLAAPSAVLGYPGPAKGPVLHSCSPPTRGCQLPR